MLGRNEQTNLLFTGKENNSCKPATTRREETTTGTTRVTALVKGSVARGHAPQPPEAHVIKYARGGAVHHIELYGRSFTRYLSELGSIFKKALHLKLLNSRLPFALMPVWRDKTKPSSKSVCESNYCNPLTHAR